MGTQPAVRAVPEKYVTTDGFEFTDRIDAEQHEALVQARDAFE